MHKRLEPPVKPGKPPDFPGSDKRRQVIESGKAFPFSIRRSSKVETAAEGFTLCGFKICSALQKIVPKSRKLISEAALAVEFF
jgi:hypothetical protein